MNFSFLAIKNHLKTRDWKWLTKIICFAAIIVLIATDQMVKLVVQKEIALGQERDFMPGFINLKYILNDGAAFSLFQKQQFFLSFFAITVSMGGIIWLLFTTTITRSLALSFIIAGTIGNLTDRFLHDGGVVDFLAWQLFPPYTIFNTADIFITVGIIIMILQLIILAIINIYQEKNGEPTNDPHNQPFTIIIDNKSQGNKSNISPNHKREIR